MSLEAFFDDPVVVKETPDSRCIRITDQNPSMLVPWWLMASFLYYHEDISLLSDELFDAISETLKDKYDELDHPHKHLIQKEFTKSGFYLKYEDYPGMCKGGAKHLVKEFKL